MSTTYRRPLYARLLRLSTLRPSGLLCFIYLEGMIALGVVVALAELASWWAVVVLPAAVAVMVKVNDMIAGALVSDRASPRPAAKTRPGSGGAQPSVGRVRISNAEPQASERALRVSRDLTDTMDPVGSPRQRFRQSARRRYE